MSQQDVINLLMDNGNQWTKQTEIIKVLNCNMLRSMADILEHRDLTDESTNWREFRLKESVYQEIKKAREYRNEKSLS